MAMMCPYCGSIMECNPSELTTVHAIGRDPGKGICPGSQQNPRNAESDGRPLWNGEANPHFYRNQEAEWRT